MAFTATDLIDGLHDSRAHLLKHLDGLRDDQWDWKPYPECKTIRETLAHVIQDDRAALEALEKNGEPDYEAHAVTERDLVALRALLAESHNRLCEYLTTRFADAPLDTPASAWGAPLKLGRALSFLTSEDFYHTGQVAFIRLATDPSWDYYTAIYGGVE